MFYSCPQRMPFHMPPDRQLSVVMCTVVFIIALSTLLRSGFLTVPLLSPWGACPSTSKAPALDCELPWRGKCWILVIIYLQIFLKAYFPHLWAVQKFIFSLCVSKGLLNIYNFHISDKCFIMLGFMWFFQFNPFECLFPFCYLLLLFTSEIINIWDLI